jgi:predicted small lipoprotein YifL
MHKSLISTFAVALALALVLAGCGDKAVELVAAPPPAPENAAPPVPDVGRLAVEATTASGIGRSAGEAMAEAMKMALLQVNGAVIQSESVSAKYGLDVSLNEESAYFRASAFAELVKQRSGGVIQSLKVLALEEPTSTNPSRYKATIEASISKFKPSADLQKIKLVIGPVSFSSATVAIGDRSVPSSEVAAQLRQRVNDALVQTGRFAILDRELSPEISRELNMISSGQAPSAELAKLSQLASADLIWSASVDSFDYRKYARKLKTSDRELVSYSGGWSLSQKVVNVATRQVTVSNSLKGALPSTEPTTMSTGVDGAAILQRMTDEAATAIVASILQRTFPLTVVARDGTNVVVGQGGQALQVGNRYEVVSLGNEVKDPQTGQSLGRMESPCCELVIDRVETNLSYGRLENVRSNLDNVPVGGLQVRALARASAANTAAVDAQPALEQPAATSQAANSAAAPTPTPAAAARPSGPRERPAEAIPREAAPKEDKW